jgi:transposase
VPRAAGLVTVCFRILEWNNCHQGDFTMAYKHNEEFKREAVRIALTSGLTRRQVASDLGIGFSTLAKWVQNSKPDDLPPAADIDLAKENERLRKENRLLLEEREVLKKATVFFANQNK